MKRKTSNLPVKNFKYGAGPPSTPYGFFVEAGCRALAGQKMKYVIDNDILSEQLKLTKDYYNSCIDIINFYNTQKMLKRNELSIKSPVIEKYLKINQEISDQHKELKLARQKAKQRINPTEIIEKLNKLKSERKKLTKEYIREKKKISLKNTKNEELKAYYAETKKLQYESLNNARKESGLFWGNYLLVDKDIEAAERDSKGKNLRHKISNEGRLGVQIQSGGNKPKLSFYDLISNKDNYHSSSIQLIPLNQNYTACSYCIDGELKFIDKNSGFKYKCKKCKKINHDKNYFLARIKTASLDKNGNIKSGGRTPVFIEIPVKLHRLPPIDATITWAWIQISKQANTKKYELIFSLESDKFNKSTPKNKKSAAIDLGWRRLPDKTMRLGCCIDSDGWYTFLDLPPEIYYQFEFIRKLSSYNDIHFNEVKKILQKYKNNLTIKWATQELKNIHAWRSSKRLAQFAGKFAGDVFDPKSLKELWNEWKKFRGNNDFFCGLEEMILWFEKNKITNKEQQIALYLEFWRHKNKHLYNWIENIRKKSISRRNYIFREWAAYLKTNYSKLVLEDMKLNKFATMENPDEEAIYNRFVRNVASPGILRQFLQEVIEIEVVDPNNTTKKHNECGFINKKTDQQFITCKNCDKTYDRDLNAAINIIQATKIKTSPVKEIKIERWSGAKYPATARNSRKISKWASQTTNNTSVAAE